MSSVALLASPVRMMVFAAWDDDISDDILNSEHPILAIRSAIGPDGRCEDDLLFMPTLGAGGKLLTVREAFPESKYTVVIQYCDWSPEQEEEKLRIVRWHLHNMHECRREHDDDS